MKVYLAGPMSICPEDFNFPAFFDAAEKLRAEGHTVFNPAEKDIAKWGSLEGVKANYEIHGANMYREVLGEDLKWICEHAEMIALLPNWEQSKGARAEHAAAQALGLKFRYL